MEKKKSWDKRRTFGPNHGKVKASGWKSQLEWIFKDQVIGYQDNWKNTSKKKLNPKPVHIFQKYRKLIVQIVFEGNI